MTRALGALERITVAGQRRNLTGLSLDSIALAYISFVMNASCYLVVLRGAKQIYHTRSSRRDEGIVKS